VTERATWESSINQQIVQLRKYEFIFTFKDMGAIWPPTPSISSKILSASLYSKIFSWKFSVCIIIHVDMKYVFYGTEDGLYVQNLECFDDAMKVTKLLDLVIVSAVTIIQNFQMLLVQTEERLHCYHLPYFVKDDASSLLKKESWRPQLKVYSKNISFFKVGSVGGLPKIVAVKTRFASSTLKIFEPVLMAPGKSKKDYYYMEQCYGILRLAKVCPKFVTLPLLC
jgi:hypothetical protein